MKRQTLSRPPRMGREARNSPVAAQPRRHVCGICGGTLPRHARRCPYGSDRVEEEMRDSE